MRTCMTAVRDARRWVGQTAFQRLGLPEAMLMSFESAVSARSIWRPRHKSPPSKTRAVSLVTRDELDVVPSNGAQRCRWRHGPVVNPAVRSTAERTPHRRAGTSIMDVTLALTLMGLFLSMMGPWITSVGRQRQLSTQQRVAQQHLSNVLEDLTTRPWSEFLAYDPSAMPIPDNVTALLPQLQQTVELIPLTDDPFGRQITVSLVWQTGRPQTPTSRLTMTAYRWQTAEEGQP